MPKRVKNTWHQTLHRTMVCLSFVYLYFERIMYSDWLKLKETEIFCAESVEGNEDELLIGLVEKDLSKIGPNNEAIKNLGKKQASTPASGGPENQQEEAA